MQTCIVHLIRASLNFVNWKERKAMAADLKSIYRAPTIQGWREALRQFAIRWPERVEQARVA